MCKRFEKTNWSFLEDYPLDLVAHLAPQYPLSLLGHYCRILTKVADVQPDTLKELNVSQGDFYFPLQVAAYSALEIGNLEDVVDLGSKALQYLHMAKEAYTIPTET